MRVLLTGANGQLGKSIIKKLPENIDLIKTSREKFNLLDYKQCKSFINDLRPDWVINCAAFTNVEKAEYQKELAFKINGDSLKIISEELFKTGGKLIHISTDYVFDGRSKIPYKPKDKTGPLNEYGNSKLIGERYLEDILGVINKGFIVRTSGLVSPFGNNFVTKMLKLMSSHKEIKVINDQFSCPTSSESLAELCWKFIILDSLNNKFLADGKIIYHFCDSGITNWYTFAQTIRNYALNYSLIEDPAIVTAISSEEYNSVVQRPKYSLLDCKETIEKFKLESIDWTTNLRYLIKSISFNNKFTN